MNDLTLQQESNVPSIYFLHCFGSKYNRKRRERHTTYTMETKKHEKLKRKKVLTGVEIIRIASTQVIRILVKIKAVSGKIKFYFSNNKSLKGFILCIACNHCFYRR